MNVLLGAMAGFVAGMLITITLVTNTATYQLGDQVQKVKCQELLGSQYKNPTTCNLSPEQIRDMLLKE